MREYIDPFICFCFGGNDSAPVQAQQPDAGPLPVTTLTSGPDAQQRAASGAAPTVQAPLAEAATPNKKALLGS